METFVINKTFENDAECEAWKEKNCPDRTYNGKCILMINHSSSVFDKKVTITDIVTI